MKEIRSLDMSRRTTKREKGQGQIQERGASSSNLPGTIPAPGVVSHALPLSVLPAALRNDGSMWHPNRATKFAVIQSHTFGVLSHQRPKQASSPLEIRLDQTSLISYKVTVLIQAEIYDISPPVLFLTSLLPSPGSEASPVCIASTSERRLNPQTVRSTLHRPGGRPFPAISPIKTVRIHSQKNLRPADIVDSRHTAG